MPRRLFSFLFLLIAFIALTSITTYFWPVQNFSLSPSYFDFYHHANSTSQLQRKCEIPHISPWHESILPLIEHPREVNCRRIQPELTYLDETGILHLNRSAVREFELEEQVRRKLSKAPRIYCQYAYFDRGQLDREINFDPDLPLVDSVKLEKNFVRVVCNVSYEVSSYA